MSILKPFLWYRHVTRGVYYATSINRGDRATGEPNTQTALMFTSLVYCGGQVVVIYYLMLFLFGFDDFHNKLGGVVIFGTHKGPFSILALLGLMLAFIVAWFMCRHNVTYEDIAKEFEHRKPSHLFTLVSTLFVPVTGIVSMIFFVLHSQ